VIRGDSIICIRTWCPGVQMDQSGTNLTHFEFMDFSIRRQCILVEIK
jgi:hypothetical protein